jgi:hypothetical protein
MQNLTHPEPSGNQNSAGAPNVPLSKEEDVSLERATQEDRRWFERNPSRCYRARPLVPGDIPEALSAKKSRSNWTLVRWLEEGFRVRVFCGIPEGLAPVDTDDAIRSLFNAVMGNGGNGFFWASAKYLRPIGTATEIRRLLDAPATGRPS